ncbi:MAG: TRAP transporter large permease subunit, partial [Hoeflea sp. D1-CHI-28]
VEASALGALGAMVFAMIARRLTFRSMMQSLINAAVTSAMIGLIVVCAQIFGYFVTVTQITQNLVGFVSGLELPVFVIVGFVVLLYLVLGCFLDQISILILTIPIVLPVMTSLGFDPIWFGIVVILIAEVGMVTPPVGLNVFIVAKKTGQPVEAVFAGVWPHVLAHILLIIALIAFPQIILWLPETMMR